MVSARIPPIVTQDFRVFSVVPKTPALDAVVMADRAGRERVLMLAAVELMQLIGEEIWITLYAPNGGWPMVKLDAHTGAILRRETTEPDPLAGEPLLGELGSRCPSCGESLSTRPSRKTRCPKCRLAIVVRKRPQDRLTVLATEADAREIDEQWLVTRGLSGRPQHNVVRKDRLLRALTRAAQALEWADYCSKLVDLAQVFERERDWSQAITYGAGALYLSAAGPCSGGFDEQFGLLPPGLVGLVAGIVADAEWSASDLEARYLSAAEQQRLICTAPLDPVAAWREARVQLLDDG